MTEAVNIQGPLKIVEYRKDITRQTVVWLKATEGHDLALYSRFSSDCFEIVRQVDVQYPNEGGPRLYKGSQGYLIAAIFFDDENELGCSRAQALINAHKLVKAYNFYDEMEKLSKEFVEMVEQNFDYPYQNDRDLTNEEVSRAVFIVGLSIGLIHHLRRWFNLPLTKKKTSSKKERK
jgi:hypothetical protein